MSGHGFPPAKLLPLDARMMLIRASEVKNPEARRKAIDSATDYINRRYAEFFKQNEKD